jgi:hypothetical protein
MANDRPTSCRTCRVYCDWVVEPVGCIGCDRLYAYDGESGRRWAGCLERIFDAEIDLEALEAAVDRGRFGVLRAARMPLARCSSAVERAYPGRRPAIGCVRPEFGEPPGRTAFAVSVRDDVD